MTLVRRPSPFSELMTLRQAMDHLFDDTVFRPLVGLTPGGRPGWPSTSATTPEALLVDAQLPGSSPRTSRSPLRTAP